MSILINNRIFKKEDNFKISLNNSSLRGKYPKEEIQVNHIVKQPFNLISYMTKIFQENSFVSAQTSQSQPSRRFEVFSFFFCLISALNKFCPLKRVLWLQDAVCFPSREQRVYEKIYPYQFRNFGKIFLYKDIINKIYFFQDAL